MRKENIRKFMESNADWCSSINFKINKDIPDNIGFSNFEEIKKSEKTEWDLNLIENVSFIKYKDNEEYYLNILSQLSNKDENVYVVLSGPKKNKLQV